MVGFLVVAAKLLLSLVFLLCTLYVAWGMTAECLVEEDDDPAPFWYSVRRFGWHALFTFCSFTIIVLILRLMLWVLLSIGSCIDWILAAMTTYPWAWIGQLWSWMV